MPRQTAPHGDPAGREFEPAYLALHRAGQLLPRAREVTARLADCHLCPRACGADRLSGKTGTCKTGRDAYVASYGPHLGEEDCLRGWRGSGTIFFASCSLRCHFCQNYDISHAMAGSPAGPEALAAIMLELQSLGCHNINLVTPSHVVPQILAGLAVAAEAGLRVPVVYNTSGYDAVDTLQLLDGVVDIYMPDFKFWDEDLALCYLGARDYPEVARQAILEMHRQVGDLQMDGHGLATRGLLVRHLVMPGGAAGTREVMRFLAALSRATYVNVMSQYRPAGEVSARTHPELNRPLLATEFAAAIQSAHAAGLHRLDRR